MPGAISFQRMWNRSRMKVNRYSKECVVLLVIQAWLVLFYNCNLLSWGTAVTPTPTLTPANSKIVHMRGVPVAPQKDHPLQDTLQENAAGGPVEQGRRLDAADADPREHESARLEYGGNPVRQGVLPPDNVGGNSESHHQAVPDNSESLHLQIVPGNDNRNNNNNNNKDDDDFIDNNNSNNHNVIAAAAANTNNNDDDKNNNNNNDDKNNEHQSSPNGGDAKKEEAEKGTKRQDTVHVLHASRDRSVLLSRGCPDRGLTKQVPSLAFVKVHKSASTTVANILARYALRHSLNVALPRKTLGVNKFNYFAERITPKDVFPAPLGQRHQVVFNHMIFHREDLEALMPPGNATFYFAITRRPLDRFVSSFSYYGIHNYFRGRGIPGLKDAIAHFLRLPSIYHYTKPEVYNSLAGDTGLRPELQRNTSAIRAHIAKMERDLGLIMLVEYFDESLVMLKRKACLTTQEIVYRAQNVRPPNAISNEEVLLTPEDKALFENYQLADVMMYEHFYTRFWDLVREQGSDFFLEVRHFKEVQKTVGNFCTNVESGLVPRSAWVSVARSAWNEDFTVTRRDCMLMTVSELHMQDFLVRRAVRLYNMSVQPRSHR